MWDQEIARELRDLADGPPRSSVRCSTRRVVRRAEGGVLLTDARRPQEDVDRARMEDSE